MLDEVYEVIRQAFYEGKLCHLIGNALDKNAVLFAYIDVKGAIVIEADNKANLPVSVRDRSMILQMTSLLSENMDAMMKKAGKEHRESENNE